MEIRATKYNPANRNEAGHYLLDEWTSVSDIGRCCDGTTLDVAGYLRTEDAYVATVLAFLDAAGIEYLIVGECELNRRDDHIDPAVLAERPAFVAQMGVGRILTRKDIAMCIRENLREQIWCKLFGPKEAYLHFGYDYYMYFGGDVDVDVAKLSSHGLFLEPRASAYET